MLSDKEWASLSDSEQGEYDACVRIADGDVEGSEYLKDSDRISAKRDIQKLETIATLRAQLAERDTELLRVRTTGHAAAHELDNIAVECGLGHSPKAGVVATFMRGLVAERNQWRDAKVKAAAPLTKDSAGALIPDENEEAWYIVPKEVAGLFNERTRERDEAKRQLADAQARLAVAEGERDSLQTESEYLFQLLSPENKTVYLERLGISRQRQEAAWNRVKDALKAADAARKD